MLVNVLVLINMLTMKQLTNVLVGYYLRFLSPDTCKYCSQDTLHTALTFKSMISSVDL